MGVTDEHPPHVRRAAIQERKRLVSELQPRIEGLLQSEGGIEGAVKALEGAADLSGRQLEVALQLALTLSRE